MAYTKLKSIKTTLNNSLEYITKASKTEDVYIGSLNCRVEKAYDEMQNIKKQFGKTDGRLGYHLIQSFKVGEIESGQAFNIAHQFADRYLGERYQVVYATHVDRQHIHNHYIFNSVSFVDGFKYHADKNEHKVIRQVSDKLCLEHGLSVIEPSKENKSLTYIEWLSEKHGKTSWRSIIKSDIDHAISQSLTYGAFLVEMERLGYEVKQGKYISFRTYGKERFSRGYRLGDAYSEQVIRDRIDGNEFQYMKFTKVVSNNAPRPKRYMPSLERRYWAWMYRLGLVKTHKAQSKPSKYLKQELLKFERYKEQFKFLRTNNLITESQFYSYKQDLENQLKNLYLEKEPIDQEIFQNRKVFTALKYIHRFEKPYELYLEGYIKMKDEYDQYKNAVSFIEDKGLKIEELEEFRIGLYDKRSESRKKIHDVRKQLKICSNIEETMEVIAEKERMIEEMQKTNKRARIR